MNGQVLPTDWAWMPISQLLKPLAKGKLIQQGWSPQCEKAPASDGRWGVLKTTSIQPGSFDGQHNKQLPEGMTPRPELEVQVGDLLMTCAGPRARCAVPTLVRATQSRLMLSGKMYRFRPDETVCDPRYLELLLLSPAVQKSLDSLKTGISESGLNLTHGRFSSMLVPIPSITEQWRIVDILEDHLSRLDAAKRELDAAGRRLTTWDRAAIDAVFIGEAERLRWPVVPLERLRSNEPRALTDGPFGSSLTSAHYAADGAKVVRLQNIGDGHFKPSDAYISLEHYEALSKHDVREGDVVIASLGDNLPRAAVVPDLGGPAIVKADCIRLRTEVRADAAWVALACRSTRAKHWAQERLHGVGRQRLGLGGIRQIPVPMPESIAERAQASSRINQALATAEALRRSLAQAEVREEALRRALLDSAFSGRLTGRYSDMDIIEESAGV